jgi:hypothetical protein
MLPLHAIGKTFGEEITISEEKEEVQTKETETQIIKEDEEKRGEYEKHFLLSDGTVTAAVYPYSIHYKESGKYVDIDNTLTLNKDGKYHLKSNKLLDVNFPKEMDNSSAVEVKNNEYTLKWKLINDETTSKKNDLKLDENKNSSEIKRDIKTEVYNSTDNKKPSMKQNKLTSSIKYNKVNKNIDIKYDIFSNIIKENIIVNNKEGIKNEYIYELEFDKT